MYSLEYNELFEVYKFLLTIPLTQVTYERSLSKRNDDMYKKLFNST